MKYLELSYLDVTLAAFLIVVNGAISMALGLKLERSLILASLRTVVQLLLIGLVLGWLFELSTWYAVFGVLTVMTVVAGFAAVGRTERRYPGIYLDSILSMFASAWIVTGYATLLVLREVEPWYQPQYLIPFAGMILGNSLNGISLGLGRLSEELTTKRDLIEATLTLGGTRWEAARPSIRRAVHTGMVPIINSMMVVGVVSLPGMMTGQLLSGVPPIQAVRYQIVIMFLIAAATAIGTVGVVLLGYRRAFNADHQALRLR